MKYSGNVGFFMLQEVRPDIHEQVIVERKMKGDFIQRRYSYNPGGASVPDVNNQDIVSLIGNKFLFENHNQIAYITHMGVKWKAESISLRRPRVEVSLGGKYHAEH